VRAQGAGVGLVGISTEDSVLLVQHQVGAGEWVVVVASRLGW
jgi:hypothetical protein